MDDCESEQRQAPSVSGRVARRSTSPSANVALRVAGFCLLGLVLLWAALQLSSSVRVQDSVLLHDFTLTRGDAHVNAIAGVLLSSLSPLLFIVWATILVAIALVTGRPRIALVILLILGLTPVLADFLKPLLARPHVGFAATHVGEASWPSGHASAALALVICAVLVTPHRYRLFVGTLGGLFAVAVGSALLVRAWHMPSDVLGGYLLASFVGAAAISVLCLAERGRLEQTDSSRSS